MVPPEKVIDPAAATGAKVGEPQLVVAAFGVEKTNMLAGKVSLNPTPVRAAELFGLVIVKVSRAAWLTPLVAGENALLIAGGNTTVIGAVFEVVPVPPGPVEVITPVVLLPVAVAVTTTVTRQVLPIEARLPPEKLIEVAFATGAKVPPHVLVVVTGLDTLMPAGKVSLNAIAVVAPPL